MKHVLKALIPVICILLTVPGSFAATTATRTMPKTLTLPGTQYPIWVDSSLALTNGRPNVELLGPSASRLAEILASPLENGCHPVGPVYSEVAYPPKRDTLTDAIVHSRSNFLGRISGSAYGFYGGIPGELFRVTPLRTFGEGVPNDGPLYFFIPLGRFKVGEDDICKFDSSYAPPPFVGGEVFLFVGRPIGNGIFNVTAEDVVPVSTKGILLLPPRFSSTSPLSKRDDLMTEILRNRQERQLQ